MADDKQMSEDWSTRHVRLRFELMACALLLAAFAFVENPINTSVILPINLGKVGEGWLFFIVLCFYAVTLAHFWTRTVLEKATISGKLDRIDWLTREIRSISENAKHSYELRNAIALKDTADRHLEHIKIIADHAPHNSTTMKGLQSHLDNFSSGVFDKNIQERQILYTQIRESLAELSNNYEEWSTKSQSQKQFFQELRQYFEEGLEKSIEEANSKVLTSFSEVESKEKEFNRYRSHIGFERMVMSCWLPASISVLITAAALGKFMGDLR